MGDTILIVGGAGQVGRIIAGQPAARFPGRVRVAGRSLERAAAVAGEHAGAVGAVQFDLARLAEQAAVLDGVGLAIICVEPTAAFRALRAAGLAFQLDARRSGNDSRPDDRR